MTINSKDMKDEDWNEMRESNKIFLDHAIKRINERIDEEVKLNVGILGLEIHTIVREELGLNLLNYDVNFMDFYIERDDEFEDD